MHLIVHFSRLTHLQYYNKLSGRAFVKRSNRKEHVSALDVLDSNSAMLFVRIIHPVSASYQHYVSIQRSEAATGSCVVYSTSAVCQQTAVCQHGCECRNATSAHKELVFIFRHARVMAQVGAWPNCGKASGDPRAQRDDQHRETKRGFRCLKCATSVP